MSNNFVYGLIALVGIVLASFIVWKVTVKAKFRSNKVTAKGGSIAVGRDLNAGDNNLNTKK